MDKFFGTAQDPNGKALVGASAKVRVTGQSTLATLYDDDQTTVLPNPLLTDTNGSYNFFTAAGTYDIDVTYAGSTRTLTKVSIGAGGGGGGTSLEHGEATTLRLLRTNCGVIIPMYIYPDEIYTNQIYDGLIQTLRRFKDVPAVVIINPSDGPDTVVDGNYSIAIKRIQSVGAMVAGYVLTGYGSRALSAVTTDMDTWRSFYPECQAIFIDEVSSADTDEAVAYYVSVTAAARTRGFKLVIMNPGTDWPERYYVQDTGDCALVWENSSYPDLAFMHGNFEGGRASFDIRRNGFLVHSQTYDPSWVRAARTYAGMLYITPDVMINPWDTVSPYLGQLMFDLSDKAVEQPLQASGSRLSIYYNTFTSVITDAIWGQTTLTDANDIAKFFCDNFDAMVMVWLLHPPTNPSYAQTVAVVNAIKKLRPDFVLWGYLHMGATVAPVHSVADLQQYVDEWLALKCDGFFLDECEYGFQTPRSKVNATIDYIHQQVTSMGRRPFACCNGWNHNEFLAGSADIYNATYNATSEPVHFWSGDGLFHESLVHHYAYVSGSGLGYDSYISAAAMATKETPTLTLRHTFGLSYHVTNLMPTSGGNPYCAFTDRRRIWRDVQSIVNMFGVDTHCLTFEGYSGEGAGAGLARMVPTDNLFDPNHAKWRTSSPKIEWLNDFGFITEVRRGPFSFRSRGNNDVDCQHTISDPNVLSFQHMIGNVDSSKMNYLRVPLTKGKLTHIRIWALVHGSTTTNLHATTDSKNGSTWTIQHVRRRVTRVDTGATISDQAFIGTNGSFAWATTGSLTFLVEIEYIAVASDYTSDLLFYVHDDANFNPYPMFMGSLIEWSC